MGEAATPDPEDAAILRGKNAREVLARVLEGDPLELFARARERQAQRAVLLDSNRLFLRSSARVARSASNFTGRSDLRSWLVERIDEAINDLIGEEREQGRAGKLPDEEWDSRVRLLSQVLGVEPASAWKACIAFNLLPFPIRRTAWAILVEGKSLNRCVAEGLGTPEQVKTHLSRTLGALNRATGSGGLAAGEEEPLG